MARQILVQKLQPNRRGRGFVSGPMETALVGLAA
ncbi:hypothetical protein ACVWZX_001292 [Deinococcus sp. UYEF24]